MKTNKIVVLLASILAFLLIFPLGLERIIGNQPYLSVIRFVLAIVLAIPTVIYAIIKYRKTASRFYVFPCFTIALGFWLVSMFLMQKEVSDTIYQSNSNAVIEEGSTLDMDRSLEGDNHFLLTRNSYDHAIDDYLLLSEWYKYN